MNIQQWIAEAQEFDDVEFSGPVDRSAINEASRILTVPFSPQYREFLALVGSASVASESFIGLGGPQHLDVVWMSSVLRAKTMGKPFPPYLIPLRSDGYGNYDAIDTARPTARGEFAIVEWRHEGSLADEPQVLASEFFEWLESMLILIRESA